MTIIVFLVDTSASMQQKSWVSGRSTFLDIAKGAVEFFVKLRQKSPESRGDRYMLLTFEEYPKNIKAGWKENLQTFMTELKNLEANGMTTMGSALKQVFDILNINRMQTGIGKKQAFKIYDKFPLDTVATLWAWNFSFTKFLQLFFLFFSYRHVWTRKVSFLSGTSSHFSHF